MGVEEGLFFFMWLVEDLQCMEEEWRLVYVGIIWVMKMLYLSYVESRCIYGSENIYMSLCFLCEILVYCLQEICVSVNIICLVMAICGCVFVDSSLFY